MSWVLDRSGSQSCGWTRTCSRRTRSDVLYSVKVICVDIIVFLRPLTLPHHQGVTEDHCLPMTTVEGLTFRRVSGWVFLKVT